MAAPIPLPASAHPVASLGRNEHDSVTEEMRKMPAKKPLIISGTFSQRQGVFFKFKQSNQVSLEGIKSITCSFIVPRDWRGDYLLVSCRADGQGSRYFIKGIYPCGESRFVVGLYLEGDLEAKQAAIGLADRQTRSAATRSFVRRGGRRIRKRFGEKMACKTQRSCFAALRAIIVNGAPVLWVARVQLICPRSANSSCSICRSVIQFVPVQRSALAHHNLLAAREDRKCPDCGRPAGFDESFRPGNANNFNAGSARC